MMQKKSSKEKYPPCDSNILTKKIETDFKCRERQMYFLHWSCVYIFGKSAPLWSVDFFFLVS